MQKGRSKDFSSEGCTCFFFFGRVPVVLESRMSSRGGGGGGGRGAPPCTLSLDPRLSIVQEVDLFRTAKEVGPCHCSDVVLR